MSRKEIPPLCNGLAPHTKETFILFPYVFHVIFRNSLKLIYCHVDYIHTITHSSGMAAGHNVHAGNPLEKSYLLHWNCSLELIIFLSSFLGMLFEKNAVSLFPPLLSLAHSGEWNLQSVGNSCPLKKQIRNRLLSMSIFRLWSVFSHCWPETLHVIGLGSYDFPSSTSDPYKLMKAKQTNKPLSHAGWTPFTAYSL